jgi:hypothetical protein
MTLEEAGAAYREALGQYDLALHLEVEARTAMDAAVTASNAANTRVMQARAELLKIAKGDA